MRLEPVCTCALNGCPGARGGRCVCPCAVVHNERARVVATLTTMYGEQLTAEELSRNVLALHQHDGAADSTRELTREQVATLVIALAEWLAVPRPERTSSGPPTSNR